MEVVDGIKDNEVEETTEKTKAEDDYATFDEILSDPDYKREYDKKIEELLERKQEEWAKSYEAKTQKEVEIKQEKIVNEELEKAKLQAMDLKVENALLLKGINSSKASRIKGLINKSDILDDKGELDEDKLNTEIEELFKTFPEFKTKNETNSGFVLGSDGKEDKKEDPMKKMRNIMGLK